MKCGIVGLPNVGKSTLFNALTSANAESSNYPFCTIEPNVGVVSVPDDRLRKISKIFKPEKTITSTIEFVDIAGLVKGASVGEGLGNKFLSHIRETDIIIHVVRCFENSNITHVSETVNPLRDIDIINTELLLADINTIETRVKKLKVRVKGDISLKKQIELTEKLLSFVSEGNFAKNFDRMSEVEDLFLITNKPVIYLCNIDEGEDNKLSKEVFKKFSGECEVLSICSKVEEEIASLPEDERGEYLESMNLSTSGLDRLIVVSYRLLNLVTFFTAGKKEVRSWSIGKGTLAPQAAGKIHTDFERGFIRAEKYHCDDLFRLGSENEVRVKGLYRSEGKDYVVQDGDVLFFRVSS